MMRFHHREHKLHTGEGHSPSPFAPLFARSTFSARFIFARLIGRIFRFEQIN
jgi:hypothetical protein